MMRQILHTAVCCHGTIELIQVNPLPTPYKFFDFSNFLPGAPSDDPACAQGHEDFSIHNSTFPHFDRLQLERFALLNISHPVECDTSETLKCPKNANFTDSLVVQIRSGDIFRPNPHPGYWQPPLVYYEYILGLRPWRQVIFVTSEVTQNIENDFDLNCGSVRVNELYVKYRLNMPMAFYRQFSPQYLL